MRRTSCLLLFAIICAICARARDCKPIRANKSKKVVVSVESNSQRSIWDYWWSWTDRESGYRVETRPTPHGRVVTVCAGERFVDSFLIPPQQEEVAASYIRYVKNGEARVDSIGPRKSAIQRTYFGGFSSRYVAATYIPSRLAVVYYAVDGKDSATLIRRENGILQQISLHDKNGHDTLTMRWSADGILLSKESGYTATDYSAEGILRKRRSGSGRRTSVRREEEFSPAGLLRSAKTFLDTSRVGVWRFYNDTGMLIRRERYPPALETTVVEPPPPPEIYTVVDQMPEFPYDLNKHLAENMTNAMRCSRKPLGGKYVVDFVLGDDGVATFLHAEGYNVAALEPALRKLFASLTGWKMAKWNGRPVRVAMRMIMKIG